jgi:TRAP-type C4-dicarboxylate transport system permease small subunit
MMKILRTLNAGVLFVERSLVVTLVVIMVLLAFVQVVLRNYFSMGILWADPLLRHMVLWVGFLGASLATHREKHISIDLITRFVSVRATNLIRILTNLFACIISFVLARAGWTFLKAEMESQTTLLTIGTAELPAWWFQLIIPVGFGLISFRFFLRILEHINEALYPGSMDSQPATASTTDGSR